MGYDEVKNEPFDEAHEVDDSEEDESVATAEEKKVKEEEEEESDDEEEEEEEDEVDKKRKKVEGEYDAAEYKGLDVSNDIKDLFQYITRYSVHDVELETTLKCFVPDYIPAVGEMDPFLKVPRPDGGGASLGLSVLDEPSAAQSDATVLELQLRAVSKKRHGDVAVRSIPDAAKSPLEIEKWINSIADLHRTKPQTQIHYRKPMPDLDSLMAEWPGDFEDFLLQNSKSATQERSSFLVEKSQRKLLEGDLEASLPEFVRFVCAIVDIPVYDNVVESLHHLFTLYLEFTQNAHFNQSQQLP